MLGKFIVFEGVEGSGKTTQLQQAHDWLLSNDLLRSLQTQGYLSSILITREPGGTPLGLSLRQLLLSHAAPEPIQDRTELLLYMSDRTQHVETVLKPKLTQGALILCDRYTDSTVAYQGYGRGLDLTLIKQLNQIATDGLQSDLTIWLDLDVAVGLSRTQQRGVTDRIEQANLDFHQRVRKGFMALADANPGRIIRVDASLSKSEVTQAIQAILQQRLAQWYRSFIP
ncbi:MAG: dTMP kinase [Cyanothece sp. SIO1E1]|nr:dTMP kinase [Cyanothece sp. SIO1E1]